VTATLGVLLIWLGVGRTARRGAPSRIATRIALIALALIVGGLAWTLRPLAATEIAIAAMVDGPRVTVAQTSTSIGLVPTDSPQPAELVFYPGGLVDPRAYANILRPIAEAGYPVTIVKPEAGKATVVGGHSLGGVVAARDAGNNAGVDGLLLWAAYPAESIADRTGLAALSIYGSEDGLTTPPEVAESVANLPPSTTFVEVAGAVHSQFGDYGDQRGDGVPTISRDAAQVQIVAATLELLDSVSRRIAP
jgi:pimeloyl-ACP methyl ester carboxylesterase